ncbi:hypothetical protein KC19_8G040200 [Ceratodon purpureus]|uniref:Uncharacterized protein n=1 Tax=Ceratodon purpureus TaxID=3225 RepID=A0A8T0GYA7_CERPU|nr:hypothetical protein KC19_8G040200 [Ceratodon purpureus]
MMSTDLICEVRQQDDVQQTQFRSQASQPAKLVFAFILPTIIASLTCSGGAATVPNFAFTETVKVRVFILRR